MLENFYRKLGLIKGEDKNKTEKRIGEVQLTEQDVRDAGNAVGKDFTGLLEKPKKDGLENSDEKAVA